ncbi:hypothetical protein DXA04_15805 [Phocaeicola vulgatus]|uniref:Uncharacterized protein n=2 Tax=Bacteroidia TaxID=200643 RepID=A0A396ELQ3_PHOVU|nr:hypothetical protein [Phocaeicola vulgatus]RJV22744.1 hypothetical protein DWY41_18820 [Bacteroides sp. AF25-17LB]RJV23208.1 hypothetical protein DWY57_19540 [Bacteroides sp. AF25-5LB]HAT99314.1 hypothetical protein [Bacteroides sp.]RGR36497.1 hypothetical protein DWY53_15690 [Phocaeicola vulgatus]RGZ13120.1 hypothetical protein DXA04_15805 [Phocaeicola vulgatus]
MLAALTGEQTVIGVHHKSHLFVGLTFTFSVSHISAPPHDMEGVGASLRHEPALFRTDTDMASLPVPVYPVEREASTPVLRVKAVGQQAVVPAGIPEDVEIGTAVQTFPAACQTVGRKYHPFVSHGFSN